MGLGYLAERWLLSIDGFDDPITVQIVEATPNEVTVKSVDYGYEGDLGTPFILDVPTSPNHLRPKRALLWPNPPLTHAGAARGRAVRSRLIVSGVPVPTASSGMARNAFFFRSFPQ